MLMIMAALAVIFILLNERQERLYVIGLYSMLAGYLLRLMMLEGHPLTEDKAGKEEVFCGRYHPALSSLWQEKQRISPVSNPLPSVGVLLLGFCAPLRIF